LYFISKRSGGIGKDSLPYNVWRAEPIDLVAGRWKAPVNAGTAINAGFETNVYVTPNESTMLVSRDDAPDSFGGDDVYLSRRVGGVWKPMTHLPAPINSKEYDYGPLISPDGQSIFVTSHRTGNGDIYRFRSGCWMRRRERQGDGLNESRRRTARRFATPTTPGRGGDGSAGDREPSGRGVRAAAVGR
jgi:hypothetical protein